ncbi:glycosyltransferase family A protein [Campylobacter concisus]|jgi:hypothetical protein|uniref:glycosyltransferase family A protein n=1 Tax=Campylobacter concisus TaxID=199 RepID=UPI000D3104E6
MEFVIIDDGSPLKYEIPDFNLNLRWIKINEDIKWNQSGARNLGVLSAKSDKLIITDLDHIFYEDTLKFMATYNFKEKEIYKSRRTHIHRNGFISGNYPSHGNVFAMSRGNFLKYFGYDEEFAGNYGYEDNFCAQYFDALGFKRKYITKRKYFYRERDDNDVNHKSSYHSLNRDDSQNKIIYEKKKEKMKKYGAMVAHSRMFLNFTWHVLSEQFRKNIPENTIKKKFWLLNWR